MLIKIWNIELANFSKETYARDLAAAIHFRGVKICPYFHEFAADSCETSHIC